MGLDLTGRIAAVLGGDGREVEIARQLVQAGATVRTCGLPEGPVEGWSVCATVDEAVAGAEIVICPVPLPGPDGTLFAPAASQKLLVDRHTLRPMQRGGILITGRASRLMKEAAEALGLRLYEYEHEEDLMLLRAPAVAEGAIRTAIEQTDVTLHHHPCLVVGFGKIGPTLAQALLGLQARVTVAARNPVQRARAWAMGCEVTSLEQLPDVLGRMAVVFNTVPARLFTRDVLASVGPRAVLIDLSAPPGGVDFEAAQALGVKAIWARGLGGRAPRTVGQSQWQGIVRILAAELSSSAKPR